MNINVFIFLLLIFLLVIILYGKTCNINNTINKTNNDYTESFNANPLFNITNVNTNHDNRPYGKYLKTSEFMNMITNIKQIIYDTILDMAKSCITMNGSPSWHFGLTQITLQCFVNDHEIEQRIIENVDKYIYVTIKDKLDVNLNSQHITHDLMRNLNLLEKVIYPLKYSKLYTVNGEQYITEKKIYSLVKDLNIKDSLMSTLERRDILLFPNNDEHIY